MIVFLLTPHNGNDFADYANAIRNEPVIGSSINDTELLPVPWFLLMTFGTLEEEILKSLKIKTGVADPYIKNVVINVLKEYAHPSASYPPAIFKKFTPNYNEKPCKEWSKFFKNSWCNFFKNSWCNLTQKEFPESYYYEKVEEYCKEIDLPKEYYSRISKSCPSFFYQTIHELAEAIIEQAHLCDSKKLVLNFALRICDDKYGIFLEAQKKTIRVFLDTKVSNIKLNYEKAEYYNYFISTNVISQGVGFECLLKAYLKNTIKPDITDLSSTMVGALLMNDLAKCYNTTCDKDFRDVMSSANNGKTVCTLKTKHYKSVGLNSSPNLHPDDTVVKSRRWNAVHFGLESESGASGHTRGILASYNNPLVCSMSIFAFWALCYDRRVSSAHSFLECFEPLLSKEINLKESWEFINRVCGFNFKHNQSNGSKHSRKEDNPINPVLLIEHIYMNLRHTFASKVGTPFGLASSHFDLIHHDKVLDTISSFLDVNDKTAFNHITEQVKKSFILWVEKIDKENQKLKESLNITKLPHLCPPVG